MYCVVKYDNYLRDYTFEIKSINDKLEDAINSADNVIKTELDLAIVSAISDNDYVDPNIYKIKDELSNNNHQYSVYKHINMNNIVYKKFLEFNHWIMCIFIVEK